MMESVEGVVMVDSLYLCTTASPLQMVSLDTTGCLEDGIWHRTDSSDVLGENVAPLRIMQSSSTFVFQRCPDPLCNGRLYPFCDPLLPILSNYPSDGQPF
ncbi:hypothetical protein TNCV_2342981 [Trichonephila clavipes]|nr:hypothetical protein TNCV_2342981 [Trichonephila clavipes]